jgi:hypothetical protein
MGAHLGVGDDGEQCRLQVDTDATLQHVLDTVVAKFEKVKEPSISFQVRPSRDK